MKDQHFDRWQFGDRRPHPVSATIQGEGSFTTPGISFEDFSRMSTSQRKTTGERRLPTPVWAVDDKKLQHLLVVFMEERAGFRKHKAPLIEKKKDLTLQGLKARLEKAKEKVIASRAGQFEVMKKLNEEYIALQQSGPLYDVEVMRLRQLENEIQGIDTYLRTSENGTVDVVAACVYLYYRTGMDSVGVAAELGIKPPHVRQTIWRLHRVADRIAGIVRPRLTKEEREARKLARIEKLRLEAEERAARVVERAENAQRREAERAEAEAVRKAEHAARELQWATQRAEREAEAQAARAETEEAAQARTERKQLCASEKRAAKEASAAKRIEIVEARAALESARQAMREAARVLKNLRQQPQPAKPKPARIAKPARARRYNRSKVCDFCGGPLPYRAHKVCKAEACQTAYAEQRNSRSTPRKKKTLPEPVPLPVLRNIPRWLEAAASAV